MAFGFYICLFCLLPTSSMEKTRMDYEYLHNYHHAYYFLVTEFLSTTFCAGRSVVRLKKGVGRYFMDWISGLFLDGCAEMDMRFILGQMFSNGDEIHPWTDVQRWIWGLSLADVGYNTHHASR
jgi:hypothetical protein